MEILSVAGGTYACDFGDQVRCSFWRQSHVNAHDEKFDFNLVDLGKLSLVSLCHELNM